jgi:hypothetical protein
VELAFNLDILKSDFVVNVPVMKTHAQAVVSLGIKNIKGMLDVKSRQNCHSANPEKNLHFMISKLTNGIPPSFTILDGIYTNERGPSFDGKIRRSNILVASQDVLSADKVGAKVLGYAPSQVPHLAYAARDMGRTLDLSDLEVLGEKIEDVAVKLEYAFPYNETGTLPLFLEKMGVKGLSYPKYDLSLCTYCSGLTGVVLTALAYAWKGQPWNDVEILTGKLMKPTPGRRNTILLGKCMYEANKNNSDIQKMIAVRTCPPAPEAIVEALNQAGIEVDPENLKGREYLAGSYMKRYEGRPEFDESLFRIE